MVQDPSPDRQALTPAPPLPPAQHWPSSSRTWAGIALVAAAGAALAWKGQYEAAILAAAWIMDRLGVGGQMTTVLSTAGLAAARAQHAADAASVASAAATHAANETTAIRESIQDSPSFSGLRPAQDPTSHL